MRTIHGTLCKVTKSTKHNRHRPGAGNIYHIKVNGKYAGYEFNNACAHTVNLRCPSKGCQAVFTLESPFNEKVGERTNGKSKFGVRTDIDEADMMDVTQYGPASHSCRPACISRGDWCSKSVHSDVCKHVSNDITWNHRIIAHQLKTRRKTDQSGNAASVVQQELAQFLPSGPLHTVPPRFMIENDLNPRRLREVVYNADYANKPACTVQGVPEQLLHFPGDNGHQIPFIFLVFKNFYEIIIISIISLNNNFDWKI